mmetsp:Transcript_11625/g.16131  ORF Transcript_11625/g.16131 Transcript_11625/m.16131 type:complete len:235 (-) Transcript_11625:198-902(-)
MVSHTMISRLNSIIIVTARTTVADPIREATTRTAMVVVVGTAEGILTTIIITVVIRAVIIRVMEAEVINIKISTIPSSSEDMVVSLTTWATMLTILARELVMVLPTLIIMVWVVVAHINLASGILQGVALIKITVISRSKERISPREVITGPAAEDLVEEIPICSNSSNSRDRPSSKVGKASNSSSLLVFRVGYQTLQALAVQVALAGRLTRIGVDQVGRAVKISEVHMRITSY